MVSRKRAYEDNDTVAAVNPAGLTSRKYAKTYKLACELVAADAEATQEQAAKVTPTASTTPAPATVSAPPPASTLAPAPVTMTEDMSGDENEGSGKVSPNRLAFRVSFISLTLIMEIYSSRSQLC